MAVPKGRHSKARTRRRRAINSKLHLTNLVECPSCGAMKRPHRVCLKCGQYKGRQVIEPEALA